jgi:hypothetical protein
MFAIDCAAITVSQLEEGKDWFRTENTHHSDHGCPVQILCLLLKRLLLLDRVGTLERRFVRRRSRVFELKTELLERQTSKSD